MVTLEMITELCPLDRACAEMAALTHREGFTEHIGRGSLNTSGGVHGKGFTEHRAVGHCGTDYIVWSCQWSRVPVPIGDFLFISKVTIIFNKVRKDSTSTIPPKKRRGRRKKERKKGRKKERKRKEKKKRQTDRRVSIPWQALAQ